MKYWRIVLAVCITAFALGLLLFVTARRRDDQPHVDPAEVRLELARTALAATENLDTLTADSQWSALFEQMPTDPSVALNRALNRVLHVDMLVEAAGTAMIDAETKESARRRLPAAIAEARQAVDEDYALRQDKVSHLWLVSRVDLQEASLRPVAEANLRRQEVFFRLTDAIQNELMDVPGSAILSGSLMQVLDELESPIDGLPSEVRAPAASAAESLSRQQPDNLFIALRAARLGIAAESAGAAAPIRRTGELTSAIEPSLRVATEAIGLTPDELVQEILEAIARQDWQTAQRRMNLWFNLLNGTDLARTDRRRASPHPLDRLSFDIHRRLSAEVAQEHPVLAGRTPVRFQAAAAGPGDDIVCALPIDTDLDLIPEIVAVSAAGVVSLWKGDQAAAWTKIGELDLQMPCSGLLAADLFMVDASDPNRLQVAAGRDALAPAARHTTLPTLVVYGRDGVKMVSIDGRATTSDSDRLSIVSVETGLEDLSEVTTAIAGDLEGDGDLDLIFATQSRGLRFFVNRGNRTFFELDLSDQKETMAGLRNISAMAIVDLDRDLDLDVVTVDSVSGQVGLIENLLHLQFRYRELGDIPPIVGADQVQIADIDGNVSWDIVVGGPQQAQVAYSNTAEAGSWVVERVESLGNIEGRFLLADFDNDSWYELLSVSDDAFVQRLSGADVALERSPARELRGEFVASADFNLNGKLDVLSITDGHWAVYENVTDPAGHYMTVRMKGIDDNHAASGRVNHYAIGSVVELRFGPHYRAQVITTPATHFGLSDFDQAGSLRVIFPNGLTQSTSNPPVDMLVEEEQTLKGSCPYLYAWDGEKFAFVTDCLWAAPLGLQVAQGVVAQDRPWEYLKVDGDHVRARDGRYEFRITEELWEIAYFDHVSLLAVDHPADVDVWTNEKVGPAAIAEPTIHAFSPLDRLPLQKGLDTFGRDVTEQLRAIDGDYVQGFDRRLRQGLCPPHWIDLDFGALPEAVSDGATPTGGVTTGPGPGESAGEEPAIQLVLTGWILPTDTSLNIQIDQNPDLPAIEFPSVWVPDSEAAGGWRNAIPFMGFPGGKTKTIVVDVSDVLNRDDPRLRVRTSAQIYWDSAHLVVQTERPEVRTHALDLVAAELRYRGFSEKLRLSATSPEVYDYSRVSESLKWPPLQGRFTAYGECKSLLERWDDSMVVMGSGDELKLQFSVPDSEPPEGWKRDFVLHCVGWDKDADLNTLTGQSSEPLPFREMTRYPPPHEQVEASDAVLRGNLDHLIRTQRFRDFWRR